MALATLSVDLVARLAKFESDMGQAARASEKASQRISQSLGVIKAGFAGLIAGLSVRELVGAFSSIVDAADELGKLSQRTGIAVETLGGLGFAAAKAGSDVVGVTTAADKLNRSLAEAASGEKLASEAFKALGISAVDAAGKTKSVDVAFAEIADKFASFADGPEKVAIAMRLFGKAGAEQIVLLNGGGEAIRKATEYYQKYSGVTEELTKQSEVFNDTLSDIGLIASGVGTRIAASLLPSLQAVADEFLRLQESGVSQAWADRAKFVFDKVSLAAAALTTQLTVVGKTYGAIFAAITSPGSAGNIFKLLKEDIFQAYRELGRFSDRLNGIGVSSPNDESEAERRRLGLSKPKQQTRASAPRLPSSGSTAGGGRSKQDKELDLTNKELTRYIEGLETAIQRTQDLSAVEEARIFLTKKGIGASTEQAAQILSLAKQIDAEKELKAATEDRIKRGRDLAIEAGKQVEEANRAYFDRLKSLTDGAASNVFKRQQEDLEFLKKALDDGVIKVDVYADSVKNLFNITDERIEKTKSIGEELGLTFTSAFEDAIVGGKKFSDILKGLEQDILRIVTRKLVTEPLSKSITGILGGGGGGGIFDGLANFAKSIFGFDGGGYTGNGARSGGLDGKGGFMAMMHPRETVIDHTKGQSAGRNIIVNVNQSFGANTSRATTMQAAADARRQLEYAGRNI